MMFFLVIAMGSSLLHCSMDDFSKVNEARIKVVSSYPSGPVEVRCPRGKKKKHISDFAKVFGVAMKIYERSLQALLSSAHRSRVLVRLTLLA